METNKEIIKLGKEQAETLIEKHESLKRLSENEDFKKVFLEGYLKDEAARLVLLKADFNVKNNDIQKDIEDKITGIGQFYQYMTIVENLGKQAKISLQEYENIEKED